MKYKKRRNWKYRLWVDTCFKTPILGLDTANEFISLAKDGLLIVRAGYCWDGPSGPTIDSASVMRGPLAHDALYQLMREGLIPRKLKKNADKFMYQCILEDVEEIARRKAGFIRRKFKKINRKWSKFRANYFYKGVLKFGASSTKSDLRTAP